LKTVLATGGLGFVGSHTCIDLIYAGYNVLIIDNFANSQENTFNNIEKILFDDKKNENKKGKIFFRKGDLRNKIWLDEVFKEFENKKKPINSVIHFAGLKAVEESIKDPLKYWDWNLNTTISLLIVMKKHNCHQLVFSSSATVYEPLHEEKIKEDFKKSPINPYGNTKFSIEKILSDVQSSNPEIWKIAILRYFNPAGSHESGLIGEDPLKSPKNLFPLIVKTGLRRQSHLSIFGQDWPTLDGTCIRDYIHVTDLAKAHTASLRFLKDNKPQIIFLNIGTGQGYSVLEVVQTFMKVNDVVIPYNFKGRREGDHYYAVANNNLALSILNWKPLKNLEDMCRDSWNYVMNKN